MNAITRNTLPALGGGLGSTSAATLLTFTFNLRPIRYVLIGGEPWFAAKDVCETVGLTNVSDTIEKLDEDEKMVARVQTAGGFQNLNVVSEGGLYTIVLRCRGATTPGTMPHRFRKHVTSEVLPEIRRTGSYGAHQPALDPASMLLERMKDPAFAMELIGHYASDNVVLRRQRDAFSDRLMLTDQELMDTSRALTITANKLAVAEVAIEEQAPAVEALDRLTNTHGGSTVSNTAKRLGVRPGALFEYMRDPKAKVRWLIKNADLDEESAYQDRLNAVEMISPVDPVLVKPRGRDPYEKLVTRIYVTPKGLTRLAKLIVEGKDPLLPKASDMMHIMRLARGDHRSRSKDYPDLFD